MKNRNKQINKEAKITVGLYLFYFVWWCFFAYYKSDDPSKYTFILGLPSWFFMSCVMGLVVINILLFVLVKIFFKDMDLD
ncbi:MAG: YhdT family protein [Fusobacteriaceae bacterium]